MKLRKFNKSITKNRTYVIVALFAVIGASLLIFTKAATPSAALSLSPASGSYNNGSNFTVGIYEDSGVQAVNSVSVGLSYDTAKVDFVSVSTAGSPLAAGGCPESTGAAGKVSVVCFIAPYNTPTSVTGKQLIANVTFKAKATGSVVLAFTKESSEKSAVFAAGTGENIWNQATAGATYTLNAVTNPDPTPTPNPNPYVPSTPSTGGGSSTPTTTTGGTTTKPTASTPSTGNTPTTTSQPAATADNPTSQTTGEVTVNIVVRDRNGNLATGTKVTLNKKVATTNALGVASFSLVAAGKYTVRAEGVLGAITKDIVVSGAADQTSQIQQFDLKLKKQTGVILYVAIAAIALLIVALGALLVRWQKQRSALAKKFVNPVKVGGAPSEDDKASPVAEVITPSPADDDTLEALEKPTVNPTDTLEEIEKKVGAKKSSTAASSNVFEPNLIAPKKSVSHGSEH